MEKGKKPPSAEDLLRKIQEMEQREAHIKQEISKLKLSANRSKHGHQTACSHQLNVARPCAFREVNAVTHAGFMEPLAIKLTETQYLNILQSMGRAIHVYHIKFGIIFWNQAAENLYGYTAAEAYGKCPTDLLVEPKHALMADYLQERIALGDNCSGEFPVRNKNGERFVIVCADRPYRDEYGRQLGAICISSDLRTYKAGLAVCPPTTIACARHGRDSQQPQQTSTPSKISNFVFKVKSKLKTGENYTDHDDSTLNQSEGSIPRIHIDPFEMLFSMDTEKHLCRKLMIGSGDESENKCAIRDILYSKDEEWMVKEGISWPLKANEREVESVHSKLGHFGSHQYNFHQAHEPAGPQTRPSSSAKLDDMLCHSGFHRIS
ncbi:PAC motif-containing protein [Tanacetum coccineum]